MILKQKDMRIQSITDVITNSSTEVFVYYQDDAAQRVIDVIDDLLEVAGDTRDALDLFEINMKPSDYYYDQYYEAWERHEIDHRVWPEKPGDDDIRKFIEAGNIGYTNDLDYEYPKWDGIEVHAKNPEHERLAKKISELLKLTDYEGFRG